MAKAVPRLVLGAHRKNMYDFMGLKKVSIKWKGYLPRGSVRKNRTEFEKIGLGSKKSDRRLFHRILGRQQDGA
ncbi:MAG: hypothetical protein DRH17_13325 [Deltaproteobacteria bacterium]|nr:MAG: hypothetical protein DRH17_13325 [Deltaproteobacteria bacterium]